MTTDEALSALACNAAGLELLVLFGSRAKGTAHPASDWDFAYIASDTFDPAAFNGRLQLVVASSLVDLADLTRAGGVLRYQVASEGRCIFQLHENAFKRFQLEAAAFWCDAAPVLSVAHAALVAKLTQAKPTQ